MINRFVANFVAGNVARPVGGGVSDPALQSVLLFTTNFKITPTPIFSEWRNAPRFTKIILYSLLFILFRQGNTMPKNSNIPP